MNQHALLSVNISHTFTQHIKVAFWVKGGGGGTGSTKQKTLKNSLTVYEKNVLDYFEVSTVQMYLFMVVIVKQWWISRKVFKHSINLVLRYVLCSYLSLFYL